VRREKSNPLGKAFLALFGQRSSNSSNFKYKLVSLIRMDPPRHVAIICDGNRRWAKANGLQPLQGHEAGFKRFKEFLNWCYELGVKEVTAYAFSMQNFNRSEEEKGFLWKIFEKALTEEWEKTAAEKKVRIRVIGRTYLLPENVQKAIKSIEQKTRAYDSHFLNICLAYGGREEITDAVKEIAANVALSNIRPDEIDEKMITEHLYLQSEPDLVIRTSGEHRTSNFLIWQSYYSEWFFPQKMLPEFSREDFDKILEEFSQRDRRFGR